MNITDWTAKLREVISDDCTHIRPFTCDGYGDLNECDLLVIGNEPKNDIGIDWWDLWDDQKGFDYELFQSSYNQATNNKPSKTREFFNHLKDKGFKLIETNAFSNTLDIRPRIHNHEVVNLLLNELPNLKGAIAHGRHARKCVNKLSLPAKLRLLQMDHFSARGITKASITALLDNFCDQIR